MLLSEQLQQRDRERGSTESMGDQDTAEVFIETEFEIAQIVRGCERLIEGICVVCASTSQHWKEKHLHRAAEFDFRYNNRIALFVDDVQRSSKELQGTRGNHPHETETPVGAAACAGRARRHCYSHFRFRSRSA